MSMNYGFKKLSEAEIVQSPKQGAHFVLEEDGLLKRIAAENIEVGGGSGGAGVSSWNDLTDKPFGEESFFIDIEWDGVIGDRPYVKAGSDSDGNALYLVHMSDEVIPSAALNGMVMGYINNDEAQQTTLTDGMYVEIDGFVMVGEGNLAIVPNDNFNVMGIIFPKAGIYFLKHPEFYTMALTGESMVVKKLDEKYMNNPVTLTVSYTYDEESGEYADVTTDFGYVEVAEAYKVGCPVFIRETNDAEGFGIRCPATIVGENYIDMLGGYGIFGLLYTRMPDNKQVAVSVFHPLMGEQAQMSNVPSSALPPIGDNGQILGVVDGEWSVMDAPSGLPEVSTENNGNVLTVVDGAWTAGEIEIPEINYPVTSVNGQTGAVQIEIPAELPEITAESENAFLRIVNGVPTWVVLENAEDGVY